MQPTLCGSELSWWRPSPWQRGQRVAASGITPVPSQPTQGVQKMQPGLWWDKKLRWTFPSPSHWKQAFGMVHICDYGRAEQGCIGLTARPGTVDA
jgi:hypothetical protein